MIVGTTNASLFAYVADGKNGLKVLQLTSPDIQQNSMVLTRAKTDLNRMEENTISSDVGLKVLTVIVQ